MKKVTLTFIVPETTLIQGAEYELEHGNIALATESFEVDSVSTDYTIEEPGKMTWKELRHEYFAAVHELRDAMLKEYNRHGEQTQVPEFWNDLHNLWTKMNKLCEKL